MKTKLTLDATGCPTNLFSFLINNARWMAESKTFQSLNGRRQACAKHIHAKLPRAFALDVQDQLHQAYVLTEQGIKL